MYIRRTLTRTLANGAQYFTHRLVRSERVDGRVRQVTLLNLGTDFTLGATQWQALCARIEGLLAGDGVSAVATEVPAVEEEAQRVAALLLARRSRALPRDTAECESVDLGTLQVTGMRSVGVEHLALWAVRELGLEALLQALGMPQRRIATVLALIVSRMAQPLITRGALRRWTETSALGELLEVDFQSFAPQLVERAADSLFRCRRSVEAHVAARLADLTGRAAEDLWYSVTVYACPWSPTLEPGSATRGAFDPSPAGSLQILGVACDPDGFVVQSASFVARPPLGGSIVRLLDSLGAPDGARVRLDEGLGGGLEAAWLRSHGYRAWVAGALGVAEDGCDRLDAALEDFNAVFSPAVGGASVPHQSNFPAGECDDAGLFISLLAYQCVRLIRFRLAIRGITGDWADLRCLLAQHTRLTVSVVGDDGRTRHLRQPTAVTSGQTAIYQALGLALLPGGVSKTVV
jgi:hypothetical protein